MKFLIYVRGNPLVNGHVRMRFRWVPKYELYLWDGKETDVDEFDKVMAEAFKNPLYKIMNPEAKLAPGTFQAPAAAVEITVADAEAVMERLAPHRLKRKPGPKVEVAA